MGDTQIFHSSGGEEIKKTKDPKPLPRSVYFTTYNDKGEILRVISCPPDHVELQKLHPNESKVMGRSDGITQKVVNGKIVNKTKKEIREIENEYPKLRIDKVK